MLMEESIFTKIINGDIPCHKIYENDRTIAFLDIHPLQPGMTLVVSKSQVSNFYELNDDDYQALWQTVKIVAKKMKQVFPDKKRIGLQVEGLDVDHTHVKLFPIDTGEDFRTQTDMNTEPDHEALADMAKKLTIV